MQLDAYVPARQNYDLPSYFSLQKADNAEYCRYWALYRNFNEDFTADYPTRAKDLQDVPFCYWIMLHERRVGGCVMLPNNVGDLFLIPPLNDWYGVLRALIPLLRFWSDPAKPIRAQTILPAQLDAFLRLGFTIEYSRRWLIAPTEPYDLDAAFTKRLIKPQTRHLDDLAQLMSRAFRDSGDIVYSVRTLDDHRKSVQTYFEQVCKSCYEASALLFDKHQLIGSSLVQMHNGIPSLRFILVHPEYRGKGTAKQLMQYAISQLYRDHPYVKLAATDGNPSQALYYNMGFVEATPIYQLRYGRTT